MSEAAKPRPKLFYAPGACSLAVQIALQEAGADYEALKIDTKAGVQTRPEYLKINPKGRVPAVVTRRGVLTEVPAILQWVAVGWPEAKLAPLKDPWAMAQVLSFNVFLCSSIHPAFAHAWRPYRYADGEDCHAAMRAKAPEQLGLYFQVVEDGLADGRTWVFGQDYSISDIYLSVFAAWLQREPEFAAERFPLVRKHLERVHQRPAVRRALEIEGLTPI